LKRGRFTALSGGVELGTDADVAAEHLFDTRVRTVAPARVSRLRATERQIARTKRHEAIAKRS
jgi:hypothetical protein